MSDKPKKGTFYLGNERFDHATVTFREVGEFPTRKQAIITAPGQIRLAMANEIRQNPTPAS